VLGDICILLFGDKLLMLGDIFLLLKLLLAEKFFYKIGRLAKILFSLVFIIFIGLLSCLIYLSNLIGLIANSY